MAGSYTFKVARDARTGKFINRYAADERPNTTVVETMVVQRRKRAAAAPQRQRKRKK
jgi:hypothetical protein